MKAAGCPVPAAQGAVSTDLFPVECSNRQTLGDRVRIADSTAAGPLLRFSTRGSRCMCRLPGLDSLSTQTHCTAVSTADAVAHDHNLGTINPIELAETLAKKASFGRGGSSSGHGMIEDRALTRHPIIIFSLSILAKYLPSLNIFVIQSLRLHRWAFSQWQNSGILFRSNCNCGLQFQSKCCA